MKKATTILLLAYIATFAQQKGTFTDSRDGKKYKAVKIGELVWMAENLNYEAKGSKCFGEGGKAVSYDQKTNTNIYATLSSAEIQANCQKYGRLYDWNTAMKACPSGWHLPNREEWEILEAFADFDEVDDEMELVFNEKKLKARNGWNWNGTDYSGTDDFGFAALPGGYGCSSNGNFSRVGGHGCSKGNFYLVGIYGYWWSATEYTATNASIWNISYVYDDVGAARDGESGADIDNKDYLFSIRCLQGEVKQGEQKWFNKDGKLKSVGNYDNGKKQGEWKAFYEDGKLQSINKYKDGKPHGEHKYFYEDGKLRSVLNYKDGKLHGEWKEFHENGKLRYVINYKDGKPYGKGKYYNKDGKEVK